MTCDPPECGADIEQASPELLLVRGEREYAECMPVAS
jgi:hypothetical protein